MDIGAVLAFLGGVGLFLLGMRLMTDGLQVAAGRTLRAILAASTRSRLRGLLSGVAITAAVQSSSAVLFAVVGFVNAGLLNLAQSVGVVYGANLGTTLTSWIVALLGFNVDLRALALPAIALGMFLRVLSSRPRRRALGEAVAGFGIFFLGLDVLHETMTAGDVALEWMAGAGEGVGALLLLALLGIAMTVVMQSSSAALAVTLTAAGSGLIPLTAAAAMVIGANVGTTSTAVFTAIGATAPARRVAAAHVVFNAVVAVAAFALLAPLLELSRLAAGGLGLALQPATVLALFHTQTKLLGIALLWPATPALVRWLERRYRGREAVAGQPRHLDHTLLEAPGLALEAATLELARMGEQAHTAVRQAVNDEGGDEEPQLREQRQAVTDLGLAIDDFVNRIRRDEAPSEVAEALPEVVRVTHYYQDMAERAVDMAAHRAAGGEPEDPELAAAIARLEAQAVGELDAARADPSAWPRKAVKRAFKAFDADYQAVKAAILRAGSEDREPVRRVVAALDRISALRRAVDQGLKAARYTRRLHRRRDRILTPDPEDVDGEGEEEPVR
ncbi:MAG: Na/Pi cotransporter family protein [Thiohalospira sp.]